MYSMNSIEEIRGQFPALEQKVYGKPLVYLDNGATSQKPQCVLDLLDLMHKGANANVHRAMHKLSDDATALYEGAREKVREFINARHKESIIFTSGTTASINLVASSFCRKFLKEGDEVIVSGDSHHSNIVPWQLACEAASATLKAIPVKESGERNVPRGRKRSARMVSPIVLAGAIRRIQLEEAEYTRSFFISLKMSK